MANFVQMQIQEQWFDINGDPASGFVLKAYEVGTTTPVAIAIDSSGGSPQATITINSEGKYEVSGNEITPYIDRDYKYAIFENASDAAANSNPYAGFYDNITFLSTSVEVPLAIYDDFRDDSGGFTISSYSDGQIIYFTADGICGPGILKTGATPADNGGTIIRSNIDTNRYWDRKYDVLKMSYFADATGEVSESDMSGFDSVLADKFVFNDTTYNGENITTVGNVTVSDLATVSNDIYDGIIQNDAGTAWLQHNHLEEGNTGGLYPVITSGNVPAAPSYKGLKQNHTNVMAFWYQDFGLEATRFNEGSIGSVSWYYWDWLFHGAAGDGYEAERHPTLGYYRGDDANVLDWQCYWLNESGVTTVLPQTRGTSAQIGDIEATWATSTDINHWMYQLFNNAKNFKQLNYSLWFNQGNGVFNDAANQTAMSNSVDAIVSLYNAYQNVNTVTHSGGTYAVVFCWDMTQLSGTFDNFSGYTNAKLWLIDQTVKFQANGFDGLCVLGRNNSTQLVGSASLEAAGCIVYSTAYVDTYSPSNNGGVTPAVTYQDLAQGVDVRVSGSFSYHQSVPAISTSRDSHTKHPSGWTWSGTTPELFETMTRNCLKRMELRGSPRMVMVYNVSEWAEGGPGLQPNMRDGKGYLSSLRNALNTVSQGVRNIGYNGDAISIDSILFPDSGGTGTPTGNLIVNGERGVFTPVLSDAASGGNLGISSLTVGEYVFDGFTASVIIRLSNINTSGMTAGNDIFIQGLPLPVANVSGTVTYMGTVRAQSVTYTGALNTETTDSQTYLKVISSVSGGVGAYVKVSDLTNGQADFFIHAVYFIG